MSKRIDYPTHSKPLEPRSWYYEEPEGITVVHDQGLARVDQILIPWRKLCAAVDRHRKIRASKVKR